MEDIFAKSIEVLEGGGTILFPTDTIWGIGCDATCEEATKKVFSIKERPIETKFIILVSNMEMLKEYVVHVHPRVETLLMYHTRPLTIIYPDAKNLPSILISDDGSIGIRLVQDPYCKNLIENFGKPLVSTSANVSGLPFPKKFGEITNEIIQKVDYIVEEGRSDKKEKAPSKIARIKDNGDFEFLRT